MQALVFEIGGYNYAVPLAVTEAILPAATYVPLPGAPAIVEGAINYRGEIVPVLDVRERFGLAPKDVAVTDHLVVARAGDRRVMLRADKATGVVTIDPTDIVDPANITTRSRHIAGVVKIADGLMLLHDLRTFLTEAEKLDLDRAGSAVSEAPQP